MLFKVVILNFFSAEWRIFAPGNKTNKTPKAYRHKNQIYIQFQEIYKCFESHILEVKIRHL